MAISQSRVETRISINAETGKAVRSLGSVKKSMHGLSASTRRAAKDTRHLRVVTEDYNKSAEKGSKDSKEALEGLRDMLGNQLGPEISTIATGFGGIEKIAKTLPGPLGLIAAGVVAISAGAFVLQKRSREAQVALAQAFGTERVKQINDLRSSLGVSADAMIEVQKAADNAGLSSFELEQELRGVVAAANATGKDGSAAVSKFAATITKTRLPVKKLLDSLKEVAKEAQKLPTIAAMAQGTALEKDAAGADKFLKSSRPLINQEMERRELALSNAIKDRQKLESEARRGRLITAKEREAVEKREEAAAKRFNDIKKISRDQLAKEQQLRRSIAAAAKREEQERIKAANEEFAANERAFQAIKKKNAEVEKAKRARKAEQRRKRIEARQKADEQQAFQEGQGLRGAGVSIIDAKIRGLNKEQAKERELLLIKREKLRLEKELQDIARSGTAVAERSRAAELTSEQNLRDIKKSRVDQEKVAAQATKDARFEIGKAAAMGAASLIDSERASAGVMALVAAAESFRNAGQGNIPGAIASGIAATQYAIIAGTGKPSVAGGGSTSAGSKPMFNNAPGQTSSNNQPATGGGVVNVNFGGGFVIGNQQTIGQMVGASIKSLQGTGYGKKAGV